MRDQQEYVYFIQGITTGRIKIGVSKDPKKRMQQMQLSEQTVLLCAVKGSYTLEDTLHNMFKEYRVHGEWFDPSERIMDFINMLDSDIEIFTDV